MTFVSPLDKAQKGYTAPILSTATQPSCFSVLPMNNLFSPLSPDFTDFSSYLDGSFASTLQLLMMSANMNAACQKALFNQHFNTDTNLPSLKQAKYSSEMGEKLANIACKNAERTGTIGRCYHGVKDSLKLAGLNHGEMTGGSAWQAADSLKNHKNFNKVGVQRDQLKSLPAGCIIVWDPFTDRKGKYHEHGHIAVTLGNGKEASDHVQNLLTSGDKYTVYVPTNGINKTT